MAPVRPKDLWRANTYTYTDVGTKTISLSDDAYERLAERKREGESFSDVVRRLTAGVELRDYLGVLDDDTAEDLERIVAERRADRSDRRRERVERLAEELDG